jgi:hypothetical protein
MISSQGQDQNAQSDQDNDILITLEKSLSLDDWSSGEARHTNECGSLDDLSDKEFARLKVRLRLHDEEVHFPPGAMAAEPLIDAKTGQAVHQVDRVSDARPALGKRLFRTVAFGVITGVLVGAAFAWQFYGDVQRKHMADAGKLPSIVVSTKSSRSDVAPVELASKTSDRVPTQDTALLQAAPVLQSAQALVAPGSSPELQHQLETMVSDVAVVRRIVERLAAVQEQMALDFATLQKSDQTVRQKVSLPPHSPAAVPPRKYAPSIARSDVVAHSPSVPVPTAPARTPLALH